MWRMGQHLVGQCVYVDQELFFIGVVTARVNAVYIAGKKVRVILHNRSNLLNSYRSRQPT